MIIKERRNRILEIVKERKYCTVNYLSQALCVAPITIRRDLTEMEHAGLITRCFGGATIPDYENREVPFDVRNQSNISVKEQLAQKAAKLIKNGDVVFLDASSTVSRMTEYLTPEQNLIVVTNSTLVIEKLKEKQIRCYLTGGAPVRNSYALLGSLAEQTISCFNANIPTFDELFDYAVGWNIRNRPGQNYMLILMNSSGAAYWKNRDRYQTQLEDIISWTSLVLNSNDKMNIYGF